MQRRRCSQVLDLHVVVTIAGCFENSIRTALCAYAAWQDAFRAENVETCEVLAPLLGKTDSSTASSSSHPKSKSKKQDTETVKALLSLSAVDTPLLMLAFAAGKSAGCASPYLFSV